MQSSTDEHRSESTADSGDLGETAISHSGSARRRSEAASAQEPALEAEPPRLTPLRELQLVDSFRAGGTAAHDALSELISAYQRRVYTICYRMVRNREDAADLTQDVLIKVIEGLNSYGGQSKLSTWVIRVAMNCCLSHPRKQKIREHQSLDAPSQSSGGGAGTLGSRLAATQPDEGFGRGGLAGSGAIMGVRHRGQAEPTPAQGVEQAQLKSAVLRALDDLDPDTRAILVLRDVQELDYQQLAEVLEVPVGTVKSRLFRARAALRSAIEGQESSHA